MEPILFDKRIAVYRWTPPAPRGRILLVHGLGEHVGRYEELIGTLVAASYELTAIDLPGHGRSHGRRGDLPSRQQLWDDLDQIRQEFHGPLNHSTLPEFFYGHSLGAHLLLLYTLKQSPQIAGMVASSPLLAAAIKPPLWKLAVAHTLGRLFPHMTVHSGLKPRDISSIPTEVDAYQADPLHHSRISARLGLESLWDSDWLREQAGQWRLPLLLMHGTGDSITSFEASADFARDAGAACTFVSWPEGRHELHHDTMKAEVFEVVLDWLNERSGIQLC